MSLLLMAYTTGQLAGAASSGTTISWGGDVAACGLSQSAGAGKRVHTLQVTQRVESVCVEAGRHHDTESLLLPPPPPPLNPIHVIDPRLDTGVASSDSYHFYLLDKPSTASRWE